MSLTDCGLWGGGSGQSEVGVSVSCSLVGPRESDWPDLVSCALPGQGVGPSAPLNQQRRESLGRASKTRFLELMAAGGRVSPLAALSASRGSSLGVAQGGGAEGGEVDHWGEDEEEDETGEGGDEGETGEEEETSADREFERSDHSPVSEGLPVVLLGPDRSPGPSTSVSDATVEESPSREESDVGLGDSSSLYYATEDDEGQVGGGPVGEAEVGVEAGDVGGEPAGGVGMVMEAGDARGVMVDQVELESCSFGDLELAEGSVATGVPSSDWVAPAVVGASSVGGFVVGVAVGSTGVFPPLDPAAALALSGTPVYPATVPGNFTEALDALIGSGSWGAK